MAATFAWAEDNGSASGTPAKGTRTDGVTECNWKKADDTTTAYNAAGGTIQAGTNSYEKWLCGHFSGSYTTIGNGFFSHTSTSPGAFASGITLMGVVGTAYTTPSRTTNSNLTVDMTADLAIGSGQVVDFGATGPEAAGKVATTNANPAYSQYLTTQLQTTTSAPAGDTATATLTLQYDEN